MKLLSGNSGNSFLLAAVKGFTTVSGILSTMIMSHALSLELYGTYSQTALIVTTATNVTALGLVDAVNFFYNRSTKEVEQKNYVNTIIGMQTAIGILAGVLIVVSSGLLTDYFKNSSLLSFIPLIAFRPLFSNLNISLQYLQVSIGRAKSVAVRNAGFATLRLIVYAFAALILKDITVILIVFLLFEMFITFYFSYTFATERFRINFIQLDFRKIKEILIYSLPMGVYVMTNSLCRDIDKMLIGGWYSTDQYAIYANCATLLPFDIVSSAFLVILSPILTRYFGKKDYEHGRLLFKNYLKIGYYTAFTFTIACMILSKEMILFLYGDKYLSGQTIFILYTIVDMIKFANLSIVLSACGKTPTLMICSLASLCANTVLNVIFNKFFGIAGSAIATVVVTVILSGVMAHLSAASLQTTVLKLIDMKEFVAFILELSVAGIICYTLKATLELIGLNAFVILILVGGIFICGILLINRKKILSAVSEINELR